MPRPNPGINMRFLDKRGRYYAVWYERGRERLRSLKTDDPDKAQLALAAIREKYGVGNMPPPVKRPDAVVYFIGGEVGAIKIGMAINPAGRLMGIQCSSPIELSILATAPGGLSAERDYHRRFASIRIRGEWFAREPELLEEIDRLNSVNHSYRPFSVRAVFR